MAETILTLDLDSNSTTDQTSTDDNGYLVKDKHLSEFDTEVEKAIARYNIGALGKEDVYLLDSDGEIVALANTLLGLINTQIEDWSDKLNNLSEEDVKLLIVDSLEGYIKSDGSISFIKPISGKTPTDTSHLATKGYVDTETAKYLKSEEKEKILETIYGKLLEYVKQDDVYTTDQVYNKDEIDNINLGFVKTDGTRSFTKPISGRTPTISSHLATKGYIDEAMLTHKEDFDPHGFTEILSNKLKKYALISNVYDKTQTYSRGLVDTIIDKLVGLAVEEALQTHLGLNDPHGIIDKVKLLGYVSTDGSTPFTAPQSGQPAEKSSELVTLGQVESKLSELSLEVADIPESIWKTSGPVEVTVGYVEADSVVPDTMTLQEVCDAIFYGKSISLEVPDFVIITESCSVTMCVHGSTALIDYAELILNGEVIGTFYKENFEDGCITYDSLPLSADTEFTFKVYYLNEAVHEETKTVKCYMPVFVGLLPKWKKGNTVTMDYLIELCKEDSNNRFLNLDALNEDLLSYYTEGLKSFTFEYDYNGPELVHPFLVVPEEYPELDSMVTMSQSFGIEAFDIIDAMPMSVPGVGDVIYKMYVYKLALSAINQKVTFNFKSLE